MGRGRKEQPVTPGGYLFLYQAAFKLDFEGWGVTGGGDWMDGYERQRVSGGSPVGSMPGPQGFKQRAAGSRFYIRACLWAAVWRIGREG